MTKPAVAPLAVTKSLSEILAPQDGSAPKGAWQLRLITSGECLSYIAWNTQTREALLVDPKMEDVSAYIQLIGHELSDARWIAVIDTHTHADHISAAARMADQLKAPLIMSQLSPSTRPQIRISQDTHLVAQSAPVQFLVTPGHTPDGITVVWGPFAFTGDTVLYGDVGRDDLPGGNPAQHYDSLQKLRAALSPETLVCPGHDNRGGRISSWATQLKLNSSITQPREDYISESEAFDAPAPALLKKSLFFNLK